MSAAVLRDGTPGPLPETGGHWSEQNKKENGTGSQPVKRPNDGAGLSLGLVWATGAALRVMPNISSWIAPMSVISHISSFLLSNKSEAHCWGNTDTSHDLPPIFVHSGNTTGPTSW